MPRNYKRKSDCKPRGKWDQESLIAAFEKIKDGKISMRQAEKLYGIPARTLARRFKNGDVSKKRLGPDSLLREANEIRLMNHILRLVKMGFSPERRGIRIMAFQFTELLRIKHPFNKDKQIAGYDWLHSFLRRHPELSIIKREETMTASRTLCLNREEVTSYFEILKEEMLKYGVMNEPRNLWNVDETDLQLVDNTVVTSAEKSDSLSFIGCCNAEGNILPPVFILKGVKTEPEFPYGLPPGSQIYMNPVSSEVNENLFLKWFQEEFIPRKSSGRNILILDGHSSHTNCFQLLEIADRNDVSLICLPNHCTEGLQPLDVGFYGPLKTCLKHGTQKRNFRRKVTIYDSGPLIGDAWIKAASPFSIINGFKVTGICPFNPSAVPNLYFEISDCATDGGKEAQVTRRIPDNTSVSQTDPTSCSWKV